MNGEWGRRKKLIKQIINIFVYTGFNEGRRPFCLKSQRGTMGAVWKWLILPCLPYLPKHISDWWCRKIVNSSNTVAVPQINGFSDSVFKIKDNGHDYKYKSLEGARFLPRNNLFLPFRHQFVMVKEGKMARVQEVMKRASTVSRKQDPQQFFREPEGAPLGTQGRLA